MMKQVNIPIVDGRCKLGFPQKCVYCGAPQNVTTRRTVSAGSNRRRRFMTFRVPYCAEHARESRRNARILTAGFVLVLTFSCSALFAITTTINRQPPTALLIFLAFVAIGLAYAGRELLRKSLSQSFASMADMSGGSHLGLDIQLSGEQVVFSFTNGQMADEFAQLNGQRPPLSTPLRWRSPRSATRSGTLTQTPPTGED